MFSDLSDNHLFEIAERLGGQWKLLAPRLGMTLMQIKDIKRKNSDVIYAAWAMLLEWRDALKIPTDEKRRKLRLALYKLKRPDIQDLL